MLGVDLLHHLPVGGQADVLGQLLLHGVTVVDQLGGLVELHSVHSSNQILHIKISFRDGGCLLTADAVEVLGLDLSHHLPESGGGDVLGELLLEALGVVDQLGGLVELHSVHLSDQTLHDLSLLFIFEKIVYRNVDRNRV